MVAQKSQPQKTFLSEKFYTNVGIWNIQTRIFYGSELWFIAELKGNSLTHKHTHVGVISAERICSKAVAPLLESCQHCHDQIEPSGVGVGWAFRIMNLNLVYMTRPIL